MIPARILSPATLVATILCTIPGCTIPIPIQVKPIDLPGWGETYTFRGHDGSLHDGGYLVVEYGEQSGFGPRFWGSEYAKAELYVIPIVDGKATIPRKRLWKSKWIVGIDGAWHPDSTTRTYVLVEGMDPIRSGPGHWFHGGEVGAIYAPTSPYANFATRTRRQPLGITREDRLHCGLRRVEHPSAGHIELLRRFAKARSAFKGHRVFGLDGAELETIDRFACEELERFQSSPDGKHTPPATE